FNNFLLSKHKYVEFLSVSDKDKKEVINRFSNGIVVDDAIAKIEVDIEPIQSELRTQELEAASVDGRIEMLSEQIETEESSNAQKAANKVQRISTISESITAKRAEIRNKEVLIASLSKSKDAIKACDDKVQALENSEESIETLLEKVKFELSTYGTLTNWVEIIATVNAKIKNEQNVLSDYDTEHSEAQTLLNSLKTKLSTLKDEYAKFVVDFKEQNINFENQIKSLEESILKLTQSLEEVQARRRKLSGSIESLKNQLAGTITCPKCEHKFILSDDDFDVVCAENELTTLQKEYDDEGEVVTNTQADITSTEDAQRKVSVERRELSKLQTEWVDKVASINTKVQNAEYSVSTIEREQKATNEKIQSLQDECDGVRRKIFDEAFELIDKLYAAKDREIKKCREDIAALESSIETLQSTRLEIENSSPDEVLVKLKASLKEYQAKSNNLFRECENTKERLSRLTEQQQRFIDFKSFIANTKIEALSKITNEFLESIGSDIRINFSGYTKLKSGKVREKISVSIIRDGVDCGSFGKFSEGERARVNLSTILAMQKLINSNCEDDKGLDLLVLDEILAAVDEEGHAKMFDSLNSLSLTALIVSHGHVSEAYPHTLIIRKEGNESRIV
ncbi:MAG: SMC family ATPase, partial [Rikenellaceae bacterium]